MNNIPQQNHQPFITDPAIMTTEELRTELLRYIPF